MTCTTHHTCDCQKERMEKLELVVSASKAVTTALRNCEVWGIPRLEEAIAALEDLK